MTIRTLLVAAAAVVLSAAHLGGQPLPGDGPYQPPRPEGRPGPEEFGRPVREVPFFRPLNDQEVEQALEFARTHMPNFTAVWDSLPPERQRRIPPRLQLSFRLLIDAGRAEDRRLYDVLAEQMKLRDEIIGILRDTETDRRVRGQAMREKTRQIVDTWLEQREIRLEQMQAMVEAERARLEEDRRDPDRLVEDQWRRLRDEVRQFLYSAERLRGQQDSSTPADAPPATQPTRRAS